MKKVICEVLKSSRVADMYLYVEKAQGLARVPEALLERFGKPKSAMTLLLTPERKLANADINKVLAALKAQGFYLQLPKEEASEMREIALANSKLSGR
ncbi:YcgL domain-containing protein [Halioxenophilus sp. WMMB6]|uniref:YcgL domain-containing protein n=1 Tax=Halioxenophilus sp. WMMB6 TaxID=3073815 RepID=UPI00295E73EC|nr:YcgL domain-containing protein [Halioxenophilus sp. WMMB6]